MNKSELEQRFLSLVDNYKQVIYKVCFMYVSDDETINDLYQEVVLNLWRGFAKFRNESKPSTWVYRISMNTCISRLRHNTKQPETVSLTMSMADLFPEESEREQLQELYRLISRLGELERALILLWLDDKSYEEIAEILSISISNVGVRINRVKAKLRDGICSTSDSRRVRYITSVLCKRSSRARTRRPTRSFTKVRYSTSSTHYL